VRLNLSKEAVDALDRVHVRFKAVNPYVETSYAGFLGMLLASLGEDLTRERIEGLAAKLTAPKLKRKLMRERLVELADQIDEDDLDKLERRIKRIAKPSEGEPNIGGNSAENG
jgi:hypothetical protein